MRHVWDRSRTVFGACAATDTGAGRIQSLLASSLLDVQCEPHAFESILYG